MLPEIYKDKETEAFWDILQTAIDELELSAEDLQNLLDTDKAKEEWLVNIASNLGVDLSKDFPLSNRARIAKAVDLYKLIGTKQGLELILFLLDIKCHIQEWFEYNGTPYHFRVDIDLKYQGLQSDTYDKLLNLIEEYKNLRSKLEVLNIYLTSDFKQNRVTTVVSGHDATIYPYQVKEIQAVFGNYQAIGYQSLHTTTVYPQQVTQAA